MDNLFWGRGNRAGGHWCAVDVVSRAHGHSSSAFTADQYALDSDAVATEAAEIVGRAIEGRTL